MKQTSSPGKNSLSHKFTEASSKMNFGCVIDAGSSGSRVHVYQWASGQSSSPITKHSSYESSPGISNPDSGLPVLLDLIELARNSLPSEVDVDTVPMFLGATAGMRILDPITEGSIMSEIRSLLHTSGFMFRDEWARTISGEEEGAFGWLVANYLMNGGSLPSEKSDTTYGAIELGGASAQFSFCPNGAILANLYPVRVDHAEYALYTHSYLYYGVDQAMMTFNVEHVDNSTMLNPCYPVGYTDPETDISGSGLWHECLIQVANLFDLTHNCYHGDGSQERCSFNGVYQPPLGVRKFIAMSAFLYTWQFLHLEIGSNTADLRNMLKRAQKVCSMAYDEQLQYYNDLTKEIPSDRRTENIHAQCFNAAYQYHLLHSGFGLPVRNTPIEIYNDIDGTQVDWALGLMLVERSKESCHTTGQRSAILKINSSNEAGDIDYKLLFMSITPTFILIVFVLAFKLIRAWRKQRALVMYFTLSQNTTKGESSGL